MCLTGNLKEFLLKEVRRWFSLYGSHINQKYFNLMTEISDFIEDKDKKLSMPIRELQDVQRAMNCYEDIQENLYRIDSEFEPLEVRMLKLKKCFMLKNKDEKICSIAFLITS